MSVKQRLIDYLRYKQIGQKRFAESVGLSAGYVNAIRNSIQPKTLKKLSLKYPDLNTGWLITGSGEMLNNNTVPSSTIKIVNENNLTDFIAELQEETKKGATIEYKKSDQAFLQIIAAQPKSEYETRIATSSEKRGIPFYNHDLLSGDIKAEPEYYIDYAPYNNCDCWVNVSGHSMEPLISHGDMIAIKEIESPSHILYGEIYAIETENYRTIKRIGKSDKKGHIRLISINKDYDDQELPQAMIRKAYLVVGCTKMIL